MGISMQAKLIYGAGYEDLSELEGLDEMLDDGVLDYASPSYDAPRDEWVVGVDLPLSVDGEAEMVAAIRTAKTHFEGLTGGLPGRIIVSPNIM